MQQLKCRCALYNCIWHETLKQNVKLSQLFIPLTAANRRKLLFECSASNYNVFPSCRSMSLLKLRFNNCHAAIDVVRNYYNTGSRLLLLFFLKHTYVQDAGRCEKTLVTVLQKHALFIGGGFGSVLLVCAAQKQRTFLCVILGILRWNATAFQLRAKPNKKWFWYPST